MLPHPHSNPATSRRQILLDFEAYARGEAADDEYFALGHDWYVQNPARRTVHAWYEAIPEAHYRLSEAERNQLCLESTLLQRPGCNASVVPCLFRTEDSSGPTRRHTRVLSAASPPPDPDPAASEPPAAAVVLHLTIDTLEHLRAVPIPMPFPIPVHVYIGDPLVTATPLAAYTPDKVTVPAQLAPGDPLFCAHTKRALVFGAYLHSPQDPATLYGLTAGHAVEPDPHFVPHRKLRPPAAADARRSRSARDALQTLGTPLAAPAQAVVERALAAFDAQRAARMLAARARGPAAAEQLAARMHQQDADMDALRAALARPHELDVAHACASEAIIRPCGDTAARGAPAHTHLLSWALVRLARKAGDNALTLHARPAAPARGARVALHVRDPHAERPLGPLRDGVVNGAPAGVVHRGFLARECAVFPAHARRGRRVACRGDAGALVTEGEPEDRDGEARDGARPRALAILYAVPERGPYALVTPLTTVLRRIRDVTGIPLQFQGRWWRDSYT